MFFNSKHILYSVSHLAKHFLLTNYQSLCLHFVFTHLQHVHGDALLSKLVIASHISCTMSSCCSSTHVDFLSFFCWFCHFFIVWNGDIYCSTVGVVKSITVFQWTWGFKLFLTTMKIQKLNLIDILTPFKNVL